MALSLSSSILPFSKFSLNPQSSRKSRKRNAFHMAVRSSLPDDSTLLLQAARYTTILRAAGKLILIATAKQYQGVIDGSIPVLIKSINWLETAEEIDDLFLGDAEVWRRASIGYAGPLGGDFPLVTKEGHNVLDVIFTSPIQNLAEVADCLDQVVGVVEHGVISRIPFEKIDIKVNISPAARRCTAVIATEDGLRIVDNSVKIEGSRA
ncbi:UNVERIFIED_CONTAM: putative ribose-5-phosphate isomerase 4, chloroplastic [Sesamum indicum]